ncbi:MAG: energy transducer TonB [Bacteroidota bacterium]|nr:energy transducer TonB [Bacteroidota bacterium]
MILTRDKNSRKSGKAPRRNLNHGFFLRHASDGMTNDGIDAGDFPEEVTASESEQEVSWNDIIFENRNREYGAYAVRRGYNRNLVTGVAITVVVVALTVFYPILMKTIGGDDTSPKAAPRKLVYSELSPPPPIDRPKPAPPNIVLPKLQKVIKFVPPKVVREQVSESTPTLSDIRQNEIGAVEVEGPAEVVFGEPVSEGVSGTDEIFTVVDQQPEYAGGYDAMVAFIKKNMVYPPNARRMQIEGTVHVSFVVSKTGEISDVKVLRGISGECDQEAVRVVQIMPRWNPGKQNGHPVNVRFIMPLKFRLH